GTEIEVFDVMLYFGIAFSLIITALQMVYNKRAAALQARLEQEHIRTAVSVAEATHHDAKLDELHDDLEEVLQTVHNVEDKLK
ncbi:MAG: hypothetical protein LBR39_03350, partial [Coriobacteriales bacterium]|nr:hypothetical protein [Coriobacteriales bacterium]